MVTCRSMHYKNHASINMNKILGNISKSGYHGNAIDINCKCIWDLSFYEENHFSCDQGISHSVFSTKNYLTIHTSIKVNDTLII